VKEIKTNVNVDPSRFAKPKIGDQLLEE
jgi:hypothetical protein